MVDYLVKAERVNGRAAMIGFTSAVIEELVTNNSISTQFMDNIGVTMSVIGLVIIGVQPTRQGLLWGVFDRNAETVNGRLTMLVILSLYLSESLCQRHLYSKSFGKVIIPYNANRNTIE